MVWAILCWISDAERRWALRKDSAIGMQLVVLNLWCRKALSTGYFANCLFAWFVLNLWCRKALSTKLVYVSRLGWVFVLNLWCRKALSTQYKSQLKSIAVTCWISDAERRWARVSDFLSPASSLVLNLWCRKALSTEIPKSRRRSGFGCWISDAERRWARLHLNTSFAPPRSVESLMPKGVEHLDSLYLLLRK